MLDKKENVKVVDAMKFPPEVRQSKILEEFLSIKPGEVLEIIAPHDPEHLLRHMAHEGLPVDMGAYYSQANPDGTHSGFFKKLKNAEERIKITSFEDESVFSEKQFNPVGIYSGNNYKVILAYIKAGQFIPVHSPGTDLIFSVYKGTGVGVFGDKEVSLKPGSVIIVPGGEKRGIRATTDMEGLHIVSPIPDEKDHMEVVRKLAVNEFQ
ncbi:hypothetical protein Thermo_01977 [Thermoplasmatales archaeon]|nr:hypothetical protein Thermo_01977 [Thermoplasmatales archaeon]